LPPSSEWKDAGAGDAPDGPWVHQS
jgi:hypothetical protein